MSSSSKINFGSHARRVLLLATVAVTVAANTSTALPRNETFAVLYAFGSQQGDGIGPSVDVRDRSGNLYGRTFSGGAHGQGTVFKLTPGGAETVLYSFCNRQNCNDGAQPNTNLVLDKKGAIFGTTQTGGKFNKGVVFAVKPDG